MVLNPILNEGRFSSGSNLWKINVFGTVESFEGCDAIQDNISAVRRFSISQGFYKCDYLSSSMHFVASGSETIVDSSSQGVYVKYNGGDVCNVDPTKTNEVITHFVCNNSAVKPVVTNVKLDYNSCLTEVFISTNASCASTMSTPFMWLVVLICCVVIVLIVVAIILVLRYRKIQYIIVYISIMALGNKIERLRTSRICYKR